jgi:CheY-like chemotaxis protein
MKKLANIKILLVDDDEDIRSILKELLIESGGLVAEASDGQDAFSQIQKHDFDVVVSDLRMPNVSGTELMELIRQYQGKAPKMIFMSAFADISTSEARAMGAEGLYLKPKSIDNLIDLIAEN